MLDKAAGLGLQLAQRRRLVPSGSEHHLEVAEVAQDEGPVGDAPHRGEQHLLGRELEVDRALGKHAVLELEAARGIGDHVGEDPLHLGPGRLRQLALVDEAGVGKHLGQRVSGTDLGVDVLELLGSDLAGLDEDGPELVTRVVRGSKEDTSTPEIEGLLVGGALHFERAGRPLPVQVHEEEGKGLRIDVSADGQRVGHRPSRRFPPPLMGRIALSGQHITMDGFVDRSVRRRLDCVPGELPYSLLPYLIDGNNLLGSWGGPQEGDDRRHEVVRRVAAFCRGRNARATVVFDGHPLRDDLAAQELGPVSVRVPPPGTDADSLIRELVERAARPAELIVVTSDKALYSYVKTLGAAVMRAHEWNALERRIASRRPAPPGGEKPEKEDDIEGWLKKFGGD